MEDLKALVVKNDMGYPQERVTSLLSLLQRGGISYLSPDKEAGPFLLYSCGDDLEKIAQKTNYPLEVIQLTALRYKWPDKVVALSKEVGAIGLEGVQLEMAKNLLIATYIVMQKQLADVIAGRADARECQLLPKNIHGLEKLMNIIENLKPKEDKNSPMTFNGNNIQVNLTTGQKALNAPQIDEEDQPLSESAKIIRREFGGV